MGLLGASIVTVSRDSGGSWTDGEYVAGAPTTHEITASIQPMDPRTLEQLPEASRVMARFKLYCLGAADLRTAELSGPSGADRITYNGESLMVLREIDFSAHIAPTGHRKYILALEGVDQ